MNIIFLDIDGVLNSQKYFIEQHSKILELYSNENYDNSIALKTERQMLNIDINKVNILKEIIDITNSSVVITSSWKSLSTFPYIKNRLIDIGIPIIGITKDNNENRGEGIKNYIKENNIDNYIIIDDEIFKDYDDEILSKLIKTSFYENGLEEKQKIKAIRMLNKNMATL